MTETKTDKQIEGARVRRNRMQMIAIMLIGFFSVGASYVVFYMAKSGDSWGTTNHGEFVSPATTIQTLGWRVEGDTQKWWLWMVASDCDLNCQDQVQKLQALHKLLNRDVDRLRRGYTGPVGGSLNDSGNGSRPAWLSNFPALAVVEVTDRAAVKDGIYIVDPIGNLVLLYQWGTDPKPILEDLKKLLKVSQIG